MSAPAAAPPTPSTPSKGERVSISTVINKGTFEVVINNFSTLPSNPGYSILVPGDNKTVEAAGHKWCLQLYPGGKEDMTPPRTYVSLFLVWMGAVGAPSHQGPLVGASGWVAASTDNAIFHKHDLEECKYEKMGRGWGPARFFKRSDLLGILKGDSMTLRVVVNVFAGVDQRLFVTSAVDPRECVSNNLLAMLRDGFGSDATLVVGDSSKRFPVHRSICAAQSRVLRAALIGNTANGFSESATGEMRIEGVDEGAFYAFLEFLYAGSSSSDTEEAPLDLYLHLSSIADRFDVHFVSELCEDRISKRICAERFTDIWLLSQRCGLESLRENCLVWISRNASVVEQPGFAEAIGLSACAELLRRVLITGGTPQKPNARPREDSHGDDPERKRPRTSK